MIDNRTKHPFLTEEENAARHRDKQKRKDERRNKNAAKRLSKQITEALSRPKKPHGKSSDKFTHEMRPKYKPGMGWSFYKTSEWMEVRYQAIKKNGLRCACCGDNKKETIFHVDHIKPRSKFPFLELELDNLQILCEACNIGKGNTDSINWQNERDRAGA